uniref:Aryl hydrocarbon receptor nuclear translocator n=1 Tax=Brachionus rotundiformis TaxID=96890 RepID=A0A4D6Q5X8_9BILA|nr:aryl hydrocarbon receptor nuclear translocator [Brachionus rotundiformis]
MMYQTSQLNPQSQTMQQQSLMTGNQGLIPQHQIMQMNSNYPTDLQISDIDKEKEKQARENHCEIERRRRVKMAAYFNELCLMVPTCNNLQRKPDKLTILRMASSHMRNLRQANSNPINQSMNDSSYKPSFLTDQELKHLILEAADGFLFVAQCDTGNIIFVSEAVQPVLSYVPTEWTNRSLFEFVHPEDLEKVKDQLSTQENSVNSTGRVLDLKTGTVKKEGHPNSMRNHIGSRRSFICRIRLGHSKPAYMDGMSYATGTGVWSSSSRSNRNRSQIQSEDKLGNGYAVLHVTGYTKIWPPNSSGHQSNNNQNLIDHGLYNSYPGHHGLMGSHLEDQTNFHLIAIARLQMTSTPNDLINNSNLEFVTRHDQNGLITFVDQRVTQILGYQPNDLLKKYLSDFSIIQDQQIIKDQLKQIYETKQTQPVQMTIHLLSQSSSPQSSPDSSQNQNVLIFKTSAYAFCNPCNEQFEFIVCTYTCQNIPANDMSQNSSLYPQTLTNNPNMHELNQYQSYHNIQQYQANMPLQTNQNQAYHMSPHLSQTQNSMYQSTQNIGNYLMMPNMNTHDMYSNTGQTSSSPLVVSSSGSQPGNSANLTMLHSVPSGNSSSTPNQNWSSGSANF